MVVGWQRQSGDVQYDISDVIYLITVPSSTFCLLMA